jgi:hypothetical protein
MVRASQVGLAASTVLAIRVSETNLGKRLWLHGQEQDTQDDEAIGHSHISLKMLHASVRHVCYGHQAEKPPLITTSDREQTLT